jgi:hypothetical protein
MDLRVILLLLLAAAACAAPPRMLDPPTGCEWAPLPLRVSITPEAANLMPAVVAAGEAWTVALGTPAFIFVALDADVLIVQGGTQADLVETSCAGPRARSVVALAPGLDVIQVYYFAAHGLGHTLGVGHSTNQQSVMQATLDASLMTAEPGPDGPPELAYRVTEHDAQAALSQKRFKPPK